MPKTGFALMSQERRREVAAMGGRASTGHKFAHGKLDPSIVGKLGGRPTKEPFFIQDPNISSHLIEPVKEPAKKDKFWGWFRRHK